MITQLEKVEEKLLSFNTLITLNEKLENENTCLKAENQSLGNRFSQFSEEIEYYKGVIGDKNKQIE